eukprot:5052329-Prymnesium_polylepis.2
MRKKGNARAPRWASTTSSLCMEIPATSPSEVATVRPSDVRGRPSAPLKNSTTCSTPSSTSSRKFSTSTLPLRMNRRCVQVVSGSTSTSPSSNEWYCARLLTAAMSASSTACRRSSSSNRVAASELCSREAAAPPSAAAPRTG